MPDKLTPLTDPENFVAVWDEPPPERRAATLPDVKRLPRQRQKPGS